MSSATAAPRSAPTASPTAKLPAAPRPDVSSSSSASSDAGAVSSVSLSRMASSRVSGARPERSANFRAVQPRPGSLDRPAPPPHPPPQSRPAPSPDPAMPGPTAAAADQIARLQGRVEALERERRQLLALLDLLREIGGSFHYPDIVQTGDPPARQTLP